MRRYARAKTASCEQLTAVSSAIRASSLSVALRHESRPATQSFSLLGTNASVPDARNDDHATFGSVDADALVPPATSAATSAPARTPPVQRMRRSKFADNTAPSPGSDAPHVGQKRRSDAFTGDERHRRNIVV